MLNLVDIMKFDDPDGGVWKQGFDIKYDASKYNDKKLYVYVVPHSHCDPGMYDCDPLKNIEFCVNAACCCSGIMVSVLVSSAVSSWARAQVRGQIND